MTHVLLLYVLRTQMEIAATECHWQSPFIRQICAHHPRSHQQPNHLILININSNSKLQCQSLPRLLISFQTKPRLGASFTIRLFLYSKERFIQGGEKVHFSLGRQCFSDYCSRFPKRTNILYTREKSFKENFFTQDH